MAVWSEVSVKSLFGAFRLDAECYTPEMIGVYDHLAKLNCVRLGDHAYVTDGQHGYHKIDPESPIRHLTAKCIEDFFVNDAHAERLALETHQKNLRSSCVEDDVLLSTAGTLGNAAVVTKEVLPANMDQDVARIHLRDDTIDPWYLVAFLDSQVGRLQSERVSTGQVQKHIALEKIREFSVPVSVPQKRVVELVKKAYKKRGESLGLYGEAENVLLKELGLSSLDLSPQLFYERRYSETAAAHRLDAEYFQPKYYRIDKAIRACGHRFALLGSVIEPIRNGFDFRTFGEGETPYVRVGDVGKGRIDVEKAERIPISITEIKKNVRLKSGDVLLTRKGSYGNAAVVRSNQEKAVISSEIMLLRLKDDEFLPDYLAIYLNSPLGFQQVERRVHGVAFYSISQPDLANVTVVKAPLSLQKRIERQVQDALAARQESQRLLADAKRMVEEMILARSAEGHSPASR